MLAPALLITSQTPDATTSSFLSGKLTKEKGPWGKAWEVCVPLFDRCWHSDVPLLDSFLPGFRELSDTFGVSFTGVSLYPDRATAHDSPAHELRTADRSGTEDRTVCGTQDIVKMVPQVRSDDIIGGTFCSNDGFADPYSVMTGFTLRAVDHGAKVVCGSMVTGVECDAKGVSAVSSTQ